MPKLKIEKDVLTILEGDDSFLAKMVVGCEGNIFVKVPLLGGKREIKTVKDSKGKVIKEKKEKKKKAEFITDPVKSTEVIAKVVSTNVKTPKAKPKEIKKKTTKKTKK